MSNPDDRTLIDDQALDEYLKRGSAVSQHYRETSADEPPAALDQRMLGMARDAVARPASSKSRPQWMRWSAPLALAASAVLVVSIVIESGVYKETTTVSAPAPAQPAAEAAKAESAPEPALHDHAEYERVYAAPAEASADASLAAPAAEEARTEVTTVAKRVREGGEQPTPVAVAPFESNAQPQFAPAPPPVSAAASEESASIASFEAKRAVASPRAEAAASREDHELSEVVVTGAQRPREAARRNGPRSTVRPSGAAESTAADSDREQSNVRDPEAWLQEIRALRDAGRNAEADEEWRRFRDAHPDYVVQPTERARPAHEPTDR